MPHDYSRKDRLFRDNAGRRISRQAVRREINRLTDYVAKEAARISRRFTSGQTSIVEFELQMQELLKSGHIIAASVGKGGRARMTQTDWGRVGSKIKWQYGYLRRFAQKLANSSLSAAITPSRARSYSSSIYVSFADTFRIAQTEFVADGRNPLLCRLVIHSEEGCPECAADSALGWISVDDMTPIGERICGDFCKCEIEFSDGLNVKDLDIKVKIRVDPS